MLGERFRAYFSDFDHRHKLRASAGDRKRFGPAQRQKVRAVYAPTAAIIGFIPTIFSTRVKL
jgi:hypothetical protein